LIGLAVWAAEESLLQRAAAEASGPRNPLHDDEQARRAGAKLYQRECAACHGANREGQRKAPALGREELYQAPPGALFWILRNGSLRRGMPSFAHLPEAQRWQIITFLQSR
jgi:mono/diheme cytochrome c family protein